MLCSGQRNGLWQTSAPHPKLIFSCPALGPDLYQKPALTFGRCPTSFEIFPLSPPLWGNHSGSRRLQWVALQGAKTHGAPVSLEGSTLRNWGKKDKFPISNDSLVNVGKL